MATSGAFDAIDRRIEEAQGRIDGCRRAIAASRVVAATGAVVLLLAVVGVLRTPTAVFSAVAAVLGGLVWLGASTASLREAQDGRAALVAARERLIDEVASRNGWRDMTPTIH